MEDCIFCKIIKGDIPCHKVYEDDNVLAFLDIKPLSKGHVLVLPKNHYENVYDIPNEHLCNVQSVVKMFAEKINKEYKPMGIVINQNNGIKAGQTIFHYHVHIKPVYEDTPVHDETNHRKELEEKEMLEILNVLRIS